MFEYKIKTKLNDFRCHISPDGSLAYITNQYKTNTCVLIDIDKNVLFSLDIDSCQVLSFPYKDYSKFVVFYLKDNILYVDTHCYLKGIISKKVISENIKGLHCITNNYISYIDSNDSNWIMEMDKSSNIIKSMRTNGRANDIIRINNLIIYLETIIKDGFNLVELICRNKTIEKYFISMNSMSYMTCMQNYLVVTSTTINPPKKTTLFLFKIKEDKLVKKFEYDIISDFTGYSYLSKNKKSILISVQNKNLTYLNLLTIRKNCLSKELNPYDITCLRVLEGKDWIFNQTGDLDFIIGQSSSSQKIVIFDL